MALRSSLLRPLRACVPGGLAPALGGALVIGRHYPVLYHPDDPSEARRELPDTLWNKAGPGPLFAAFGAVLPGPGFRVLRSFRAPPRPSPPPGRDPAILSGP